MLITIVIMIISDPASNRTVSVKHVGPKTCIFASELTDLTEDEFEKYLELIYEHPANDGITVINIRNSARLIRNHHCCLYATNCDLVEIPQQLENMGVYENQAQFRFNIDRFCSDSQL